MEKKILALLGVGFSDLRQIALTFCHRIVITLIGKFSPRNLRVSEFSAGAVVLIP
jgi:hypothetical protein